MRAAQLLRIYPCYPFETLQSADVTYDVDVNTLKRPEC